MKDRLETLDDDSAERRNGGRPSVGSEDVVAELERLRRELTKMRQEREELVTQLEAAEDQARRASEELESIWQSTYWKLMTRLTNQRWLSRLWLVIPDRVRRWAKTLLSADSRLPGPEQQLENRGALTAVPEGSKSPGSMTNAEVLGRVRSFLEGVSRRSVPDLVMFVSGVKYLENEGQRSTQMARELVASGSAVLMVYFRWPSEQTDPVPLSDNPNLFHLPLDLLDKCRDEILSSDFKEVPRRTCIIEFPHPESFQLVNELNATGWHTVYDIIDDWEAFHARGAAVWYEPAVEKYLCLNAGSLTAVVPKLVRRIETRYPNRVIHLVPNGVSITSFETNAAAVPIAQGQVTLGYFGYLSNAWFDWDLILETARARPNWELHIIGYGDQPSSAIPANVHLHGKVDHSLLYAFASSWDVAVVPFKDSELSRGADPIKVYEYLAMHLPVVVTGIPHLADYPGVLVAEPRDNFVGQIELAAASPFPEEAVAAFLRACSWRQRARAILTSPVDATLPLWLSETRRGPS